MAKTFGKFLIFSALVGAAAAGAYLYLNREECTEGDETFSRDVDNFFENKKNREYVSLNNIVSEGKENLKNVVEKAAEELKEKAESLGETTGILKEDESKDAADFAFKEFKDEEENEKL